MKKLNLFTHPFTWGIVALIPLYFCLTPWVYPGEAATLLAHLTGTWQAADAVVTAHPLVSLLFGALGKALSPTVAVPLFNLLAMITGALCVTLLCQIVRHCVHYLADEPRTLPAVEKAANAAAPMAGLALLISPTFLRAASHFQWQIFDLFLALSTLLLLFRTAQRPTLARAGLTAFIWGLIAFESPMLLAITPLFAIALLAVYCAEQHRLHVGPLFKGIILPLIAGALVTFTLVVLQSLSLNPSLSLRAAVLVRGYAPVVALMKCFAGPWILVVLTGILPSILAFFVLREAGKNHRTPTLFFTFLSVATLAVLAVLPQQLGIETLLSNWGECYQLLLPSLTAFAFASLTAISVLFCQVNRLPEAANELAIIRPLCRFAGYGCRLLLPIALLISAATLTFSAIKEDKVYTHLPLAYTDALLDCAEQGETWMLSDGFMDAYLALRVAQKELPVVVFSLSQDKNPTALAALRARLEASALFAQQPELRDTLSRALDIGLIPFIQDWIRTDKGAEQHFVTLGLPDLWYTGNRLPLPQGLWYRGVSDRAAQHAALSVPCFKTLESTEREPGKALSPSLAIFRVMVRRQQGFILNNVAFYLADAGKTEEAYSLFKQIYTNDSDNISALFNIFELINGGLHPEDRTWCEQELNERVRRLKGRRYQLWALARTYGYIRSPQLISMFVGAWAMSGQTGAALSGLDLALAMLDDGKRVAFNQVIADLYKADPSRRGEAIAKYRDLLNNATDRRQSLVYVRELVRMNILEGDLAAAKAALEQLDPTGDSPDLAYERALWFASAGQEERARTELERCLEVDPRHTEALAMLATLQLQAGELAALTSSTLPKLKTAAGTEDNYFVQIITAQLAEKNNALVKARTAYLRALALKPEVHALRNTILTLDIRHNDKAAAAQHAKEYLYQDRKLPLANYIMGSLALGEGNAKRALSYLSQATAPDVNPPLPEAFNDLAEAHRQLGDWPAALAAAEHACKLSPKLAIARETAAAALLELGRYAEAHNYLAEAFALEAQLRPGQQPDPRLLITRARLHEKEGHPDLARVDLAAARGQYDSLDKNAKAEFDALAVKVNLN